MYLVTSIFTLTLLTSIVYCQLWSSPTIDTSNGRIRGSTIGIGDGRTIHAYYGIPYAASPTKGNRFRVSL